MQKAYFILVAILCTAFNFNALAQHQTKNKAIVPAYLNTTFATEERVTDLIARLTLAQKIKLLMHRGLAIDSGEVKVPAYNWWNECLHGVARAGKATVFPQAIGLAATWDTALLYRVASAISDEGRAKYEQFSKQGKRGIYQGLNFWTPNINIFRDPRWGRGMETYGEDPHLTGRLAVSFIKGIQGNHSKYYKAIATIKHFVVHSGPEGTRNSFDASVSDYDLYTTYTPAFEAGIKEAKVYSVMCAYNRFRGEPCCGSSFLMDDLLRKRWGFNGFIVTDCGAVNLFHRKGAHEVVATPEEASALAIKSGVDLECGNTFQALDVAIKKGLVTEAELDVALKRLFTARFKLGFFDDPKANPYTKISYNVVESEAHKKLALESARKSIVLLKNENKTLPLSNRIKTVAVIGPNADDEEVMLANYHGFPSDVVTPLKGLQKGLPDTKILYAKGSLHVAGVPSLDVVGEQYLFTDANGATPGLTAVYYNNNTWQGTPSLTRVDKKIDFYWINHLPSKAFDRENFSVRWTGYLKAPVSGTYSLGVYGYDQFRLLFNDSLLSNVNSEHEPQMPYKKLALQAGQLYKIEVRFASSKSAPLIKLKWEVPGQNLREEALALCKNADAVVMCMGLSPRLEGEEMKDLTADGFLKGDRTKLALPQTQLELIKAVHALGKPVVLVLLNGSAVAINWEAENIPAIVEAWYGGQEGGTAIADVLTGAYNPSGRLPVTFYKSENDLPDFEDYNMQGRTYRYFKGKPLYEFGYGLSYTSFAYSNLLAKDSYSADEPLTVSIDVKNTGAYDGEEVVQLYLTDSASAALGEVHRLKAFQKVFLRKGEKKRVSLRISSGELSIRSLHSNKSIIPGRINLFVSGGQPKKNAESSNYKQIKTIPIVEKK